MDPHASAPLAHAVYFSLHDASPASREKFLDACRKYLSDHPGLLHFSVGERAAQYARPVNDQQFDVGLVLVFATVADHDCYQQSERHQQFLAQQLSKCSKVRVFDSCG